MQAKNSKWVSTSFSLDTFQGDDDVISCECRYDRGAPDNCSEIVAKDLSLIGRSNLMANEIDASQNLCVLEGEYTSDGDIYCKVRRNISEIFPLSNVEKCFYQFYAAGDSNLRLDRHVRYEPFRPPLRSTGCVQFRAPVSTNIKTVQVSYCEYWKPHLMLSVIAFVLAYPIAAFMWHFMVPTLGEDRRSWYVAHIVFILSSLFFSIVSFCMFYFNSAFAIPSQYRISGLWLFEDEIVVTYEAIGIAVLFMSFLTACICFCKFSKFKYPNPRFIFDVAYSICLYSTLLISTAYILIGLFITAELNCYSNPFFQTFYPPGRISRYIMGGWIFCAASIYFLFDIYHVTDERVEKDKQIYQMAAMQDHKLLPDGSLASTPYPQSDGFYTPTDMPLRKSVFAVFVTVCFIFSLSLIISVGLS